MAARWAVPDRIHRPTGLKGIADSPGEPVRPPEDLRAEPPDIERYLGNGYLEPSREGSPTGAAVWRPPRGQRGRSRRRDAWAGLDAIGNGAGKARGRRGGRRLRARG